MVQQPSADSSILYHINEDLVDDHSDIQEDDRTNRYIRGDLPGDGQAEPGQELRSFSG